MNWIIQRRPPEDPVSCCSRETPENLWVKCPETGEMVFHKDLEANLYVVPGSGYHMRIAAEARLKTLFDDGAWDEICRLRKCRSTRCKFRDEKRYTDRLKEAAPRPALHDAVTLALGHARGMPIVAAVQDFDFMGGSLGMAAGEAIVTGIEAAVERSTPFVIFAASGGARMQEGILSLMQMPRTTVAVAALREPACPISSCYQSDDRRRHRLLRHAGRHPHRRARRADRLCRRRASSSRPSARSCRKASSAPNI